MPKYMMSRISSSDEMPVAMMKAGKNATSSARNSANAAISSTSSQGNILNMLALSFDAMLMPAMPSMMAAPPRMPSVKLTSPVGSTSQGMMATRK